MRPMINLMIAVVVGVVLAMAYIHGQNNRYSIEQISNMTGLKTDHIHRSGANTYELDFPLNPFVVLSIVRRVSDYVGVDPDANAHDEVRPRPYKWSTVEGQHIQLVFDRIEDDVFYAKLTINKE